MTVESIIRLIKDRDQSGLAYLYDHYSAALLGIIIRIVGSEKLGEEILQRTFLNIWESINLYDEKKSTLFTWMSRIARNAAIDQRRLKKFEHHKKTDSFDINVHNNKEVNLDQSSKIDIETLMKNLDEKYKSVIDCVYLQGYSQSEAAEKLGIPLGTVKTRLRKGIMNLRTFLKNEKEFFIGLVMFIILQMFILWI